MDTKNWVDWHEYMSREKADNYEFASAPVVEKFAFLLGRQSGIMDKIPVSVESKRLSATRPLLMGIASNAIAAIKLALQNFGNEVYPILRSLVERVITFYYLQACIESEFQNYIDYSAQKTYRLLSRGIKINEKAFSIGIPGGFDVDQFPELKKSVEKYTSPKSRKPITKWSNTSLEEKLAIIDKSGVVDISLLMIALVAVYDDGSEALHGTLYGCTFHLGSYKPGISIECPEDMSKHHRENLAMAFFLFGLLLGQMNSFVADKLGLEKLGSISKDTDEQIIHTLDLCLGR